MGRPSHGLTGTQVQQLRAATDEALRCTVPNCPYTVADDGAWAPHEVHDVCALHRQRRRNAAGVCPNCAGTMQQQPIINELTGAPRTSAGVPLHVRKCASCGYTQRPTRKRGRHGTGR